MTKDNASIDTIIRNFILTNMFQTIFMISFIFYPDLQNSP